MEFTVADVGSGRSFEFAGEAATIARCPAPPTPPPPPWTARRLDSSLPAQLDTGSLPGALNVWCTNPAEVPYGHISTWDVSAVTDMQNLVPLTCRSTFNADINGWDVGQVTNMEVRRCPASRSQGSCAHSCSGWRLQAMCVCWRGAVYVQIRFGFQPAFGSVGRQPGHQHAGAPPPCVRATGLWRTHSCSVGRPQAVCV